MLLGKLGRIVLLVRDFDASLRFYRDTLELQVVGPVRENWVVLDGGSIMLCLHGPWQGMSYRVEDFGRSPDELLFAVDDVAAVRAELIARGVAVSEPHRPGPGLVVAEFADPDGRRIGIESRSAT